jgi:hypothetical protein
MSFLFQRRESVSSPTSPHSKRTSLHHIGTMASAALKIRTPEEAGTSYVHAPPQLPSVIWHWAVELLCRAASFLPGRMLFFELGWLTTYLYEQWPE